MPTNMANTCCKPSGTAWRSGIFASNSYAEFSSSAPFYHIPGSFTSLQVFVTSIENYSRPEPGTVGLFRVFIHIFVISRTSHANRMHRGQVFLRTTSQALRASSPSRGASGEEIKLYDCQMPAPTRSNGDDRRQWRNRESLLGPRPAGMQATAKQTLGAATRAVASRQR